ncbi:translation initiation factor IF-2 [Nonlabens ponticola]|uniref:Translation initiation factor IF-2 n=1 Tax=Nonlabens ponticola TaxID=2496866 RepID=A0A3S9N1B2_9FLAO|nr:translation initiation factor IF-2 [Nonlabens ponticola]
MLFTVQATFSQATKKLNEATIEKLVATKIDMDKAGQFNDRYTIYIYQGDVQKANSTKSRYDNLGLPWKSELKYEEPNMKVYVGKYRSRLEAERALLEVRKVFPNARVLKP